MLLYSVACDTFKEGARMQNSHIGYLIKTISDRIKIHADDDLKRHNLTLSQSRVLIFLLRNGGKAMQKEIEEELEVSHPTTVGLVSRMAQNGFLTVRPDMDDRRNRIVCLTQHAIEVGSDMDNLIGQMDEKMLSSIPEEQQKLLVQMLEIIYKNVN